ncbi:MAG TPA: PEP-CTERM sorting domain-containing protein [Opitutaceae bacterium]|nr:PEP-CTERM sorting domain-containing protein [Opitutaceae bacterium]
MHPRHILTLAALLTSGVAFGQSTLNWADIDSWSLGLSTGSYNTLAGAGAANSNIKTLTYDLGSGLTATVSVARDAGVTWQESSNYGSPSAFAPAVTAGGVLGLGIVKGTGLATTLGATYTIHFNQAVTLDSFRIGDIDSARDVVAVTTNSGALSILSQASQYAPVAGTSGNTLTLTSTVNWNESNFTPAATTSWTELTSGTTAVTDLTVTLAGTSGSNHGVWLGSLEVTAAIPEPSTYAAVLGACTLALVVWRRRARG